MATATTTPIPQWVSAAQIPTVFGLSARTITDAVRDGDDIERRYIGNKPLYNVESINTWIDSHPEDKPTEE